MSKSSTLSISLLLIFEMQLVNGALFLKANFLSYPSLFAPSIVIVPLATIYVSHRMYVVTQNTPDLSIDVLNLICFLVLYIFPD